MTFNFSKFSPIDFSQEANALLPATAALAAVALTTYLFFRKKWKGNQAKLDAQAQCEID